jgi:hypothetical protein
MDLLWGYYQVKLCECDLPYRACATPGVLFEYLVTPMGHTGSLGTFNRLSQNVFADLRKIMQFCVMICMCSQKKTHIEALNSVLKLCEKQNWYIKLAECQFVNLSIC